MKSLLISLLLASCIAQPPSRPEGVSQEDWDLRRGRDAFGYELRHVEEDDGNVLEVVAPRLAVGAADSEIWRIDLHRNRVLGTRPLEDEECFPDAVQFRQQKTIRGGTAAVAIEYTGHHGDSVCARVAGQEEILFDRRVVELGDYAQGLLSEAQVIVRAFEDLDGDGVPEVLVLSTFDVWNASDLGGSLCCLGGISGDLLWLLRSADGFWEQELGALLSPLPDLDGDGVRDLLCRAFRRGSGSLITVSGKTGIVLEDRSIGMSELSRSAALVGDLDGDGIEELAIGSAIAPFNWGTGKVEVFSPVDWSLVARFTRADCMDGLRPLRP